MSLIIFDMDGVIVNVNGSYFEAARRTADTFYSFLNQADQLPQPLFAMEDAVYIKGTGGLNNDWDFTYKLIDLLANVLDTRAIPTTIPDLAGIDAAPLALFLKARPAPLKKLYAAYPGMNGLFSAFYAGEIGQDNVIKQIFQEFYLGKMLFQDTYGLTAQFAFTNGLINDELLFLQPAFFKHLAQKHTLAIGTGRPLKEAMYTLDKHNMRGYFKMLLSHDDCVAAAAEHRHATGEICSFGKPHPFMLDTIRDAIGNNAEKCYFVGDMPDDMQAARNAKADFTAVGVAYASKDMDAAGRLLKAARADIIIKAVNDLENYLLAAV